MTGGDGGDRWLVVNADDLGRTRGINGGVFTAHRSGLVTSATLMVGFAAAEDAARALAVLCDPAARALAAELGLRLVRFGEACAS